MTKRTLRRWMRPAVISGGLLAAFVVVLAVSQPPHVAGAPNQTETVYLPFAMRMAAPQGPQRILGTMALDPAADFAVSQAVAAAADLFDPSTHYAVTAVDELGEGWSLISVIGLGGMDEPSQWNLVEHMVSVGLTLVKENDDGAPVSAYQGTDAFSELIQQVPDELLSAQAKADLDPLIFTISEPLDAYMLPWTPGARMFYGVYGVHANGFAGVVPGWQAVDFVSMPDTPNRVIAAASGTVGYRCEPLRDIGEQSTAFVVGDFFYTHLLADSPMRSGRPVAQGEALGRLQTGPFGGGDSGFRCGYAYQGEDQFHLHFGFASRSDLALDEWTLTTEDEVWRSGGGALGPGECCLVAGPSTPAPTETPTDTPIETPTETPASTLTGTPASTTTATITPTSTITPMGTITPTVTVMATETATVTVVPTPTPTDATVLPTETPTPEPTVMSETPTPAPDPTDTETPATTVVPTPTATETLPPAPTETPANGHAGDEKRINP